MEKIKWLISVALGMVATFCDKYAVMIVLVLFAMCFDVVTGLIKAKITGTVSSQEGTKGFLKKFALLVCLFFGFFLDYAIPYMVDSVGIEIPFNTPFGLIISCYLILNESISVCENLYACDPNIMPKWIVNILQNAKEKIDNENVDEE